MSPHRWSLGARLRTAFATGALVLVIVPAAINAWIVGSQAEREVAALVREELHEFGVYAEARDLDEARLEEIVARLSEHHGNIPLSIRLWTVGTDPPSTFGSAGLLGALSGLPLGDGDLATVPGLRRDTMILDDGRLVECAVDGREILGRASRVRWTIGGVGLGAIAIALLVAELVARRTSNLLKGVADGVRRHPDMRAPLAVDLPDPPEEIREVVVALEALVERARAEDDRTRLLISSLAHELRAPIQNLVLESEVALMSTREPDELRRVLGDQLELGRELADAVDNLVTLCRADRPSADGPSERFDAGHEARLRSERWERTAARKRVALTLDTRGDLELVGDREAALRALRNLVANAIEWSPPKSAVEVEIVGDDDAVEMRVHDRGRGVSESDRERAFEPFVRLDEGGDRRAGYGLGLSIVRRAAERFGGTARLDARPGGGTTAVLRLPRERDDARATAAF